MSRKLVPVTGVTDCGTVCLFKFSLDDHGDFYGVKGDAASADSCDQRQAVKVLTA